MDIKARDLIAAGWREGRPLGAALKRARELEAAGLSRAAALGQLEREYPKYEPPILLRETAGPVAEAIEAETPGERATLASVRTRMGELLRIPVISRGAVMPDACPTAGGPATIPVGGAVAVENAIIPGAHSADICCSLFASFFPDNHPLAEVMDHLCAVTHFGAGGRPRGEQWHSPVLDEPVWDNPFLSDLRSRARDCMGTQGDGNHFAYVGRIAFTEAQQRALASAGYLALAEAIGRAEGRFSVLVTHHGSRSLGAAVYKRGQDAARSWCNDHTSGVPDSACWLPFDTVEGRAYWEALRYVGRWTRANHALIHEALLRRLGLSASAQVGNEHNFVWRRGDTFVHGKGATPAWTDAEGRPLLGLIPLNMAREILMVLGSDNGAFLSFCPHGAGRNRSRTAVSAPFRSAEGLVDPAKVRDSLAQTTAGLDIRWHCGNPDISESPLGYKDAAKVRAQIARFGLAEIVGEIQPRGCVMAGEAPERPWARARREKRARYKDERREDRRANEAPQAG